MFEQYDDILTIEEVAELLRIGMTQAYRIVRSGNLKGYKEGKKGILLVSKLVSTHEKRIPGYPETLSLS